MDSYLKARFSEIILVILILLNILDFFKFLPEDIDFIKKIISWTLLGVIFWKVSFMWLFFGSTDKDCPKRRIYDGLILFFYLSFFIKNLVQITLGHESELFHGLFIFFNTYAFQIEIFTLYFSFLGLLFLSIVLALSCKINSRSLFGNLNLQNKNFAITSTIIFITLISFYLLVFDLILEWLGIAVDSLLIMTAIAIYAIFIVRHHKRFNADTIIYKIGSFGEDFYEHFIKFFHDKDHILLGISGLLVLHLLTEVGNFLFPYIFNLTSSIYFVALGHEPLYQMLLSDIMQSNAVLVILTYLLNIVAVGFLIFLAAFVWHEIYVDKREGLSRWALALFFTSFPVLLTSPVFRFKAITQEQIINTGLVGVNIVVDNITYSYLATLIISSVIFGFIMYMISRYEVIRKVQYHLTISIGLIFLFYYLFLFYSSTANYYHLMLTTFLEQGLFLLLIIFALFYLIKVVFILFGGLKYLIQIARNHLL